MTVHYVDRQWDRLRSHLNLDHDKQFVVHALRHTCASRLIQRGVPLAVVQKWMGHKAIQTTLRYAHLAPDSLRVAMEALEQERGQPQLKVVGEDDF
jgi:integrase